MNRTLLHLDRLRKQYHRYVRKLKRLDPQKSTYRKKTVWIKKRLERIIETIDRYRSMATMHRKAAMLSSGLILGAATLHSQEFTLRTSHPFAMTFGDGSASPAFIDDDGDGDQDMFLFAEADSPATGRDEALSYYENTGSAWVPKANIAQFPIDMGIPEILDTALATDLVPAFVDFDADGDLDLFIGIDEGELRYLRNDDGNYVAVTGADDPFDAFDFGSNTKPALGDVDGDGDIDAMIGESSGVRMFINDAGSMMDMGMLMIDGEDSDASPSLYDIDEDGDLDLLVGNKYGDLFYFDNNAGTFTQDASHPLAAVKVDGYASLAFADVDFDGDMDLVAGETGGRLNVFAKEGSQYSEVAFNDLGLVLSGDDEAAPSFTDIDGDGDLDLMMGTGSGQIIEYTNNNGDFVPMPFDAFGDIADEISDSKLAYVDYDNDSDLDVVVGSYGDPMLLFNYNASGRELGAFEQVDTLVNPFFKLIGDNAQVPAFSDVDADGDMDLIIGNKGGDLKYFVNNEGSFDSAAVSPFAEISVPSYSVPAFVDIDGDGDMDLLVGAGNGEISTIYNNEGTYEMAPAEDNPFNGFAAESGAAPSCFDFDGDGDMDVLVGDGSGSLYYFENTGGSVGVNDKQDVSMETKVFPNPFKSELQVNVPWNSAKAILEVYDQLGRRLLHQEFQGVAAVVQLGALPSGTYHVKIQDTENRAVKLITKF